MSEDVNMDNPGVGAWVEEDAAGHARLFQFGKAVCGGSNCLSVLEDAAEHMTRLEYSRQALMGATRAVLEVVTPATDGEAHALQHLRLVLEHCSKEFRR